jgi:hypothetical protein
MAIKKKTDAEQYQYVCMFEEPKQARLFKKFLASSKAEFTHLEDAGHTICFVGSTDMLAIVETYKIPDGITLQLERRPAGSDPDEAEADGTVECFAYYGTD